MAGLVGKLLDDSEPGAITGPAAEDVGEDEASDDGDLDDQADRMDAEDLLSAIDGHDVEAVQAVIRRIRTR